MKRGIGLVAVIVALGALLGVSPAHATTAVLGDRCTGLDYSEAFPPYRTHMRVGSHAFGADSVVYWIHMEAGWFASADRTICSNNPVVIGNPVNIQKQWMTGQPQCTASTSFAAIVNGQIAMYDYVGQQTASDGILSPFLHTFRFWHVLLQTQPGVWTWWDSTVAEC